MNFWPILLILVLGIPDDAFAARRKCRSPKCGDQHYILRHFHAGPEAPIQYNEDSECGYVFVEDVDARRCEGERSGDWRPVSTNCYCYGWDYERNCPLYNDNESPCDPTYDWPGRHTEGWMDEASY